MKALCLCAMFTCSTVLASAQSPWTKATADIPWAPRTGEAVVVHDGQIWVLGGSAMDRQTCRNDVWSSSDGVEWRRVTTQAPWVARTGLGAVSFNGRLWLMGGYDCDRYYYADLWSTEDGEKWEEHPDPPWRPRDNHEVLVFDDKMWVLGGGYDNRGLLNDVWYTEDGNHWIQATADAGWPVRTKFATAVHQKTLWIMGGRTDNVEALDDVWCSQDGITWEKSRADVGWPPTQNHDAISFAGKLWILGGEGPRDYQNFFDHIWSSTDGSDWTAAEGARRWLPRANHTVVEFNDNILLIGGSTKYGDGLEIWKSSDGVSWENPLGERWGPRQWHSTVVHDDHLWVVGGVDRGLKSADVWKSPDGFSWTRVTGNAPWKWYPVAVWFRDRLWAIGGHPRPERSTAWSSVDGADWIEEPAPPFPYRWRHTVTVYDEKIWVIGGHGAENGLNDVWMSPDGKNWTEIKTPEGRPGLYDVGARAMHAAAAFDGRLWIAGGVDANWDNQGDVWWTKDGATWTQATPEGPFQPLQGLEMVVHNGHMWLLGGTGFNTGSPGGKGDKVWYTKDGANWRQYGSTVPWGGMRKSQGVAAFRDRIWMLGGETLGRTTRANDVWYTDASEIEPIAVAEKPPEPIAPTIVSVPPPSKNETPEWRGELGVDWVLVKSSHTLPPRIGATPFVFGDQLWLHSFNAFWTTADGRQWDHFVTGNGAGAPHSGPYGGMTLHNGEIWLMASDYFGEGKIWKSSDGREWELVTDAVNWDAQSGWIFSFDGKLWYVGGKRPSQRSNVPDNVSQVWTSDDGKDWKIVVRRAPWDGREGYNRFVFDGKMWIVGGWDRNQRRDIPIWSSVDGENWSEFAPEGETAETLFQTAHLFTTGDTLWAVDNLSEKNHSIWSTTDAVEWQKRVDNIALPPNTTFDGIEHNGLWLVMKYTYPEPPNDARGPKIFYSPDLQLWTEYAFNEPWQDRYKNIMVGHNDRLLLFDADPGEQHGPLSRVYESDDGASWTLKTAAPEWGEREEMAIVSYTGKLWMLGGTDAGRTDGNPPRAYNDVWVSDDGAEWTVVNPDAPWAPRAETYALTFNERLVLMCGRTFEVTGLDDMWFKDVWSTSDGRDWQQLTGNLPFFMTGDSNPPVVFDGKIWVVGGFKANRSHVWNSSDGVNWSEITQRKGWDARIMARMVVHDGRLWAFGRSGHEWTSDGVTWNPIPRRSRNSVGDFDRIISVDQRMWRRGWSGDDLFVSGPES